MPEAAPLPPTRAAGARLGLAFGAVAVAAVVIVAAAILLGSQSPPGPPAPPQPNIILSGTSLGPSSSSVRVLSATASVAPIYYRVGMTVNGTTMMGAMPNVGGGSIQFTMTMGMSSMMFTVQWMDRGTMGSLDTGDMFYVNRSSSMMGCVAMTMDFRLGWWNGSIVAHAPYYWSCTAPSKPVVTFSSPTVSGGYVSFVVAGASTAVVFDSYKFNLGVNGTFGAATTLAAANQTIAVGSTTFYVVLTDISGSGTLTAGDPFRIGKVGGGPMPSGSYSFYLLWTADGSTINYVSWSM